MKNVFCSLPLFPTLLFILASVWTLPLEHAQGRDVQYAFTNFVGMPGGRGNVDGIGSAARFNEPMDVAVDSKGNVYVADSGNHMIRKVTPDRNVGTLAGSIQEPGSADGIGSAARFNEPGGVAVDSAGTVYVADTQNNTIRKVTPS